MTTKFFQRIPTKLYKYVIELHIDKIEMTYPLYPCRLVVTFTRGSPALL